MFRRRAVVWQVGQVAVNVAGKVVRCACGDVRSRRVRASASPARYVSNHER